MEEAKPTGSRTPRGRNGRNELRRGAVDVDPVLKRTARVMVESCARENRCQSAVVGGEAVEETLTRPHVEADCHITGRGKGVEIVSAWEKRASERCKGKTDAGDHSLNLGSRSKREIGPDDGEKGDTPRHGARAVPRNRFPLCLADGRVPRRVGCLHRDTAVGLDETVGEVAGGRLDELDRRDKADGEAVRKVRGSVRGRVDGDLETEG